MSLQTDRGDRVDVARQEQFLAAHAACHDKVYRYFRRRTEGASTAEDLCAEVFRIAWEKCRQDQDASVLVVFGIARNVLRNHYRSAVRSHNLTQQLERQRTHQLGSDDGMVQDALDRLKPEEREVLLLTYWDGFTSAEVSDLLNVTATAVRMRLHRARKELSNLLRTDQTTEDASDE
ncbi:RNA polymerase sigma factor [Paenarthrobacter aurescens]|uniref:RNA polymerase sigma factor n=1 Tax=Paenarthrobacter aurescens TaxID=43663 RepID=UPI0021BE3A5E|nr:sigma-70 family RNA polymerase sigma factor [Paenarthrobacter aurescens]MCT9869699.1 sigma-70 family RNA polymerase sigma factor [Paenarthrobacter aurescens]